MLSERTRALLLLVCSQWRFDLGDCGSDGDISSRTLEGGAPKDAFSAITESRIDDITGSMGSMIGLNPFTGVCALNGSGVDEIARRRLYDLHV